MNESGQSRLEAVGAVLKRGLSEKLLSEIVWRVEGRMGGNLEADFKVH